MEQLTVYFDGWGEHWPLGKLADNGSSLLFEYTPEAIAKGIEFSPRFLKLSPQTYGNFPEHQLRLPGLISDALPDGWGMLLMDRFFRKSGTFHVTPLQRLAFMGSRAMGALSFMPATTPALLPDEMTLPRLAQAIQQEISDHETPALAQLLQLGGSPHGARPKALVHYDPQQALISTRENASGTPWLIKFPGNGEHREVCAIEALYAQLAHLCGLEIPATRFFDLGKAGTAFGIERFDRHAGMRVPLHSLAGLLHMDFRKPTASYQHLLRATRLLTHSEAEVCKAFERCVFNVIFHQRDDHAKNFAFRLDASWAWKLAPCYDLSFNEGIAGEHFMDVEGEGRSPDKSHLMRLAVSHSLNERWAQDTIARMTVIAGHFREMAQDYPIRTPTRQKIARAIEANRNRMG